MSCPLSGGGVALSTVCGGERTALPLVTRLVASLLGARSLVTRDDVSRVSTRSRTGVTEGPTELRGASRTDVSLSQHVDRGLTHYHTSVT